MLLTEVNLHFNADINDQIIRETLDHKVKDETQS